MDDPNVGQIVPEPDVIQQVQHCPICWVIITCEHLLEPHLAYCRARFAANDPMRQCVFNSMHVIPASEELFHVNNCPDRFDLPCEVLRAVLVRAGYKNDDGSAVVPNVSVDEIENRLRDASINSLQMSFYDQDNNDGFFDPQ